MWKFQICLSDVSIVAKICWFPAKENAFKKASKSRSWLNRWNCFLHLGNFRRLSLASTDEYMLDCLGFRELVKIFSWNFSSPNALKKISSWFSAMSIFEIPMVGFLDAKAVSWKIGATQLEDEHGLLGWHDIIILQNRSESWCWDRLGMFGDAPSPRNSHHQDC